MTLCNEYNSWFKDHFNVNMCKLVDAKVRLFDSLTFYMIKLMFYWDQIYKLLGSSVTVFGADDILVYALVIIYGQFSYLFDQMHKKTWCWCHSIGWFRHNTQWIEWLVRKDHHILDRFSIIVNGKVNIIDRFVIEAAGLLTKAGTENLRDRHPVFFLRTFWTNSWAVSTVLDHF